MSNRSGQGAVEYVLILFITVTILIGGIYQFHDAFKKFTDNYFGEYLQCLLESGELPTLGYQGDEGICESSFQAFDIANGRPPVEMGSGDSASGGGEAGSGSSSPTANNSGKDLSQDRVVRDPGAGSDGPSPVGSSVSSQSGGGALGSMGQSGRLRQSRVNRSGSGAGFGGKNKVPTNFPQNTYTDLGGYSDEGLRRRYVVVYGDEEEEQQGKNVVGATQSGEANFSSEGRTKKVPINENKTRNIANEEDKPLGLGGFLRYLVIAAMIIAVLLFLGGQLQSISKSME